MASTLLCSVLVVACGGGGDDGSAAREQAQLRWVPRTYSETLAAHIALAAAAAPASAPAASTGDAEPVVSAPPPAASAPPAAASAVPPTVAPLKSSEPTLAGDAATPSALVTAAAAMRTLADATPNPGAGTRAIAPTDHCQLGFVTPPDLVATRPAALPANGGVFYTERELATWRARTAAGPFVNDGDWSPGSPGDWSRIQANARLFREQGEPSASGDETARWPHGHLARDAAFAHLIAADARTLAAVRDYLVREANAPQNDFARTRCLYDRVGSPRDGYFAEAPWLTRYIATYDAVRPSLGEADRLVIENYVRRTAWFFAAHLDHFLADLFPARLQGDYSRRSADAASTGASIWASSRVDSNGDCTIDGRDDPASYPVHAYVRADGSLGPRISVLALWYNNRRATHALAIAAAGVLLGDNELIVRAKRYVMEWLTYSVYADGSSGEFGRNGGYCIARQGVIYNSMNIQAGLMSARILARQGDRSLMDFATRDGLFGSESAGGERPKSLALVAETFLRISTRELDWYQAEPQRGQQQPREATSLSRMDIRYMGSATAIDDFHELTMLSSAAVVPQLPVAAVLMRERSVTTLRWPGSSGQTVVTGPGSWSDAWGVLPAAYLLRP